MNLTVNARRMRRLAFTIAGSALLLAGCADTPLSTFDAESEIAQRLDSFLVNLLIICIVVYIIIQGLVIYMARRFGVKAPDNDDDVYPDDEFPEQTHGNTRLEIGWTIIPTVIMAVVAFFTMGILFDLEDIEEEPEYVESVTVVGQQWWWEFQYNLTDKGVALLTDAGLDVASEGPHIVTAGEMPLPVGEETHLDVTSRDVIHSFWVPNLNGKRDAVPGRINTWTIEAGSVGRFHGECTEFCGLSHAYMEKWVVGLEEADWITWAVNQAAPAEMPEESTAAFAGWETFKNNCASCHVVNGLTSLGTGGEGIDDWSVYTPTERAVPVKLIDHQTQVAGIAPNLTHVATRSTFAGGVFDLYKDLDQIDDGVITAAEVDAGQTLTYMNLATEGELNRGALENWIVNAPEMKANFWASADGQRGMTPFTSLSAEDVDNLVEFLMTLD